MGKKCSGFVETKSHDPAAIFAVKNYSMIEIENSDYDAIADALSEAIEARSFFNGSIDYECDNYYSTLTATLIIYRDNDSYPEGEQSTITNIVPVWWEFSAALPDGDPAANDFSFGELKARLLRRT